MKRNRLITALLVLAVFFQLFSGICVYASENMATNSGFDKNTDGWIARYGATVTWDENGHTGGCAKVKLNGGYSSIGQNVNFKAGRTYDISFYIRLEEGSSTVMVIQNYSSGAGGWSYLISNEPINEKWKKVSMTYNCTGYNSKGGEVDGDGTMEFRIGDGQTKLTHYIDELVIQQRPSDDDDDPEPTATPEPTVTPEPLTNRGVSEKNFEDMRGHWAENAVLALASNGLADGVDDMHFSPDIKMTRAEFTKLVVSMFRLENSSYNGAYSDVSPGSWYAEYIQTAKDIGLISPSLTVGGKFMPDEPITRQDAAVILKNAADIKGVKVSKKTRVYTDENEIALYAKEAVSDATGMGLTAGFDDGSFRPEESLTRAQGFVMFLNLMNHVSRAAVFVDAQTGSDSNNGTMAEPLATVGAAKALVQRSNQNMKNNIFVFIKGGEYYIDSALEFTEADSGTNGYNIIYMSYGGTAKLTGGIRAEGFSLYDNELNIYRAKVGKGVQTRQMFVNGVRAVRARSASGLSNCTTDDGKVGHTTTDTFLADYKHVDDLEMVYYEQWTNPRCGVSKIEVNDGIATLVMDQPGWNAVRNKGGTSVTSPAYYENAIELLDEPGEWYLDSHEGYLYYIPRAFEDINTADVVLPVAEKLVNMEGTADENVHNIYFKNLEFAYTTWLRPSTENGHSDAQNNHIRQTGVPVMPDSAVKVTNGRYINFIDCKFDKLGITALQLFGSIKDCNITGNEFYDISGSAISLGQPDTGNADIWNPKEEKYVIRNNKITNNYIHTIAVDYKSAAAISAGFPKDTLIAHNEIFDAPYSGMHIGYGWNTKETTALENFRIENNYIHSVMSDRIFDGGGIYLMGATAGTMENPNLVSENYIESIKNYYGALYPDEGTQFWKITKNVIDLTDTPYWYGNGNNKGQSKWLHCWSPTIRNMQYVDNYSTVENRTYNGVDSVFEEAHVYPDANWPEEAQSIMDKAGLEEEYLERFAEDCMEVSLTENSYELKSGDSFKITFEGKGRKKQSAGVDYDNIYFRSRNSSIASVTEDGTVTALSQGQTAIVCDVLLGDIIKTYEVSLTIDDTLEEIKLNTKRIQLEEGYDYTIKASAYSKFGKKLELDTVTAKSADENIAKADGMSIKGISGGETQIKVTASYDGEVTEKIVPVKVLAKGEAAEDIEYDFSDELSHPEDWTMDNNVVKAKITNGMLVSTPSTFIAYAGGEFKDELFNFDIKINAESGWPSVCFRASDTTSPYSSADLYMLTFGKGSLELQRFNEGARTVIYGAQTGYESLGGEAVPCSFEYGKKYTVKCGARNEADGVRIVVYINNVKVMDYLDTDEKAIRNQGYFEVYCRSGSMELTSPSR
jgi:hypothetical protein